MKTRNWIILIGILLVFSIALSVYFLIPRDAVTHARILSDGVLVRTVDLRFDQEFTVTAADGSTNHICVRDGKIAVTEATCPDHYCMQRGFCAGGADIVCLPNRLVIRFVGEQEIDGVVG